MFQPDREEIAWAAGFFDGEGSFHACYRHKRKDGTQYIYPQTSLTQAGDDAPDILARFNLAVGGIGKVYGPWLPPRGVPPTRKIRYQWETSGLENVQAVGALLWHHLGQAKRNKLKQVLAAYHAGRRRS